MVRVAVLGVLVGLGLAGCTATSDSSGGATPSGGSATSSPDRTAPGSSTAPIPATGVPGSGVPGSAVPGTAPGPPAEDFCTQMRLADASSRSSSAATAPSRADIDAFVLALDRARSAGPVEVRAPLTTLIDTYRRFAEILEDPASATGAELEELFFDPRVTAADAHVREVVARTCGFALSGTPTTSAPSR